MQTGAKPHVLVLGSNFAGLGSAQKIREYAGDSVDITVIDRKDYLLFVPNIPTDVVENRDPSLHQRMQLRPVLAGDDIAFVQGLLNQPQFTGCHAYRQPVFYSLDRQRFELSGVFLLRYLLHISSSQVRHNGLT